MVIHLRRRLPERAYQHLGVVGHDVADELRIERRFHGSQRVKDTSDEVIQRLHQECVGQQITMKFLRFLANQSRHVALVELVFRIEKLRNHYLQRVFVRFNKELDDDTAHVFSDKLENIDILSEREAS